MKSNLSCGVFVFCYFLMDRAFGVMSKKYVPNTWSQGSSMFSLGSSVTFGFTFKSVNYFE